MKKRKKRRRTGRGRDRAGIGHRRVRAMHSGGSHAADGDLQEIKVSALDVCKVSALDVCGTKSL